VAIVTKHSVWPDVGDEQIDIPVVVIIPDGDAHAIPSIGGTAGIFCLLEPTISPIDIKLIGRLFEVVERAALYKIGVEVAVSVEVGQCRTTTNDLWEQVPAGKSCLMPKRDASRDCFFAEPSDAAPVDVFSGSV
tara:strand:- start:113 stop:514 length:402 start_codon:yes stop_codon:yes gene_type:complete